MSLRPNRLKLSEHERATIINALSIAREQYMKDCAIAPALEAQFKLQMSDCSALMEKLERAEIW